jgi:hypothetical protein
VNLPEPVTMNEPNTVALISSTKSSSVAASSMNRLISGASAFVAFHSVTSKKSPVNTMDVKLVIKSTITSSALSMSAAPVS